MGLLEGLLGAVLGGQAEQRQGSPGDLGGLGDLLSGLGGQQAGTQQGGRSGLIMALLPVVLAMLQNRGGGGGLGGLLQQFQAAGLGQQTNSWVSSGANMPISTDELTEALGRGRLSEIAAQAGVSEEQASDGLSVLLPELVNQLTPAGQMPAGNEVDDALGDLQRSLGI